jgi:WNK lysine deficient protein kinase
MNNDSDGEEPPTDTNTVVEISPKGRFTRSNEELGRGSYKIVYKGIDSNTGNEVAWNTVQLSTLPKSN